MLEYLEQARSKTSNPWQSDDYQVAWQTARLAAELHPDPWNEAFLGYYGRPLRAALAYWAERDRLTFAALERCRLTMEAERLAALPPKKLAQSERRLLPEKVEKAMTVRPLVAQGDDPELLEWLANANQDGGGFLSAIARAALVADHENYPLLRPLLIVLRDKYSRYEPSEAVKAELRSRKEIA